MTERRLPPALEELLGSWDVPGSEWPRDPILDWLYGKDDKSSLMDTPGLVERVVRRANEMGGEQDWGWGWENYLAPALRAELGEDT